MPDESRRGPLVTRSQLISELSDLGVDGFPAVMVHTSMSSIGWIVGGAPTLVDSLLHVLGPSGTLLVLTGWEDRPPYHQDSWALEEQRAYRDECPPFQPSVSRAEVEDHGRLPEAVRTWPGARHSAHPVCAFAAIGADAEHLVSGQSLDEGYGAQSPLARLVELSGAVLLLGAPLNTVTLLHHAEYLAAAGPKRWVEYDMPVLVDGERSWRRIRELDSSLGAFPYEQLDLADDEFEVITRSALAESVGRSGTVGATTAHLFAAAELVEHAVARLETWFRSSSE